MREFLLECGTYFGFSALGISRGLQWVMWMGLAALLLGLVMAWIAPRVRATSLSRWLGLGVALGGALLYAIHLVWLLGGGFFWQVLPSYLVNQLGGNLLLLCCGLAVAVAAAPNRSLQFLVAVGFSAALWAYIRIA
jgi:hypothetical protein